jgi:hypothetical protein
MMARCNACNREYHDQALLKHHFRTSSGHSWCDTCHRGFSSRQAMKQQLRESSSHGFRLNINNDTEEQLPVHLEHVDEANVGTQILIVDSYGYTGIPRALVTPVFALARRLRFGEPSADDIIRQTKTSLNREIVSALMEAAVHLLPPDNSPQGLLARQEKQEEKTPKALSAEAAFLENFTKLGYQFLGESQQKELMASTPDMRFLKPTLICGHLCLWLEYKHFFGFRANPFVASKNKKQFKRYAAEIGPGIVVYKLGFESEHLNIDGIRTFRENEVLLSLTAQDSLNEGE